MGNLVVPSAELGLKYEDVPGKGRLVAALQEPAAEFPAIALERDFPAPSDIKQLTAQFERAEGRYLVGFKRPEDASSSRTGRVGRLTRADVLTALDSLKALGAEIVRTYHSFPMAVVQLRSPEPLERNTRLGAVDFVEGDVASAVLASEVVPGGHSIIRFPTVWSYGWTGVGATITVLDSGVDQQWFLAGELNPLTLPTCLTVLPQSLCWDENSNRHGTSVAGVAWAASNGFGVVGGGYGASSVHSIRLANGTLIDPAAVVAALDVAIALNRPRHVVNMSFASPVNTGVHQAIARAAQAGILLVAAAGNTDGGPGVKYPAGYTEVVAVTGTTPGDAFASAGSISQCPGGSLEYADAELSAPFYWDAVLSAHPPVGTICGTSFASPAVTAVAALVWGRNPGWTASQVRAHLQSRAVELGAPGRDAQFGFGRVDAVRALYTVSISITGPTAIQAGLRTWTASGSGGETPYSYQWYRRDFCSNDWTWVGSGASYSEQLYTGMPSFWLQAVATSDPLSLNGTTFRRVGPIQTC